jgi:hypothetical protein
LSLINFLASELQASAKPGLPDTTLARLSIGACSTMFAIKEQTLINQSIRRGQ